MIIVNNYQNFSWNALATAHHVVSSKLWVFSMQASCTEHPVEFTVGACFTSEVLLTQCISLCAVGQVFTGSRDKTVRRWDARSATHLGAYSQPDMIVSMSLVDQHLVVATGDRQIIVYDIRQMSHPIHMSETLRCQTCCVRCYPSGTGILWQVY